MGDSDDSLDEHSPRNMREDIDRIQGEIDAIAGKLEEPPEGEEFLAPQAVEHGYRQVIVHWIQFPITNTDFNSCDDINGIADIQEAFTQSALNRDSHDDVVDGDRTVDHGDLMVLPCSDCRYICYVASVDRMPPNHTGFQDEAPTDAYAVHTDSNGQVTREFIIWSQNISATGSGSASVTFVSGGTGSTTSPTTGATSTVTIDPVMDVTNVNSGTTTYNVMTGLSVGDTGIPPTDAEPPKTLFADATPLPAVPNLFMAEKINKLTVSFNASSTIESILLPVSIGNVDPVEGFFTQDGVTGMLPDFEIDCNTNCLKIKSDSLTRRFNIKPYTQKLKLEDGDFIAKGPLVGEMEGKQYTQHPYSLTKKTLNFKNSSKTITGTVTMLDVTQSLLTVKMSFDQLDVTPSTYPVQLVLERSNAAVGGGACGQVSIGNVTPGTPVTIPIADIPGLATSLQAGTHDTQDSTDIYAIVSAAPGTPLSDNLGIVSVYTSVPGGTPVPLELDYWEKTQDNYVQPFEGDLVSLSKISLGGSFHTAEWLDEGTISTAALPGDFETDLDGRDAYIPLLEKCPYTSSAGKDFYMLDPDGGTPKITCSGSTTTLTLPAKSFQIKCGVLVESDPPVTTLDIDIEDACICECPCFCEESELNDATLNFATTAFGGLSWSGVPYDESTCSFSAITTGTVGVYTGKEFRVTLTFDGTGRGWTGSISCDDPTITTDAVYWGGGDPIDGSHDITKDIMDCGADIPAHVGINGAGVLSAISSTLNVT